MPERGIYRSPSAKGFATPTNAPVYVSSGDNLIHLIPAGSGTTEVIIPVATSTSGARTAAGSGTLVSGTATVATGLASVLSFIATLNGPTGFATGATEVSNIVVSSVTTGSVVVKGVFNAFVTGAATLSVSGTGGFFWQAVGM